MYKKYSNQIHDSNAYIDASGFWTGYIRFNGNKYNKFVNLYSGLEINPAMFNNKQPNNLGKF